MTENNDISIFLHNSNILHNFQTDSLLKDINIVVRKCPLPLFTSVCYQTLTFSYSKRVMPLIALVLHKSGTSFRECCVDRRMYMFDFVPLIPVFAGALELYELIDGYLGSTSEQLFDLANGIQSWSVDERVIFHGGIVRDCLINGESSFKDIDIALDYPMSRNCMFNAEKILKIALPCCIAHKNVRVICSGAASYTIVVRTLQMGPIMLDTNLKNGVEINDFNINLLGWRAGQWYLFTSYNMLYYHEPEYEYYVDKIKKRKAVAMYKTPPSTERLHYFIHTKQYSVTNMFWHEPRNKYVFYHDIKRKRNHLAAIYQGISGVVLVPKSVCVAVNQQSFVFWLTTQQKNQGSRLATLLYLSTTKRQQTGRQTRPRQKFAAKSAQASRWSCSVTN